MNEEFINAFRQLDLPTKKDKLSRELLVIGEYIKDIEKKLNFPNEIDIYNYHPIKDKDINEDDYITSLYQDVFNIERELITIERLMKDLRIGE